MICCNTIDRHILSYIIKSPLSDTRQPSLAFCPENHTSKAARFSLVNVSWPEPVFTESLGFELNITSTYDDNTTSLGWGEHRVEYTARNTYNNQETTCVFYVDVSRTWLHQLALHVRYKCRIRLLFVSTL